MNYCLVPQRFETLNTEPKLSPEEIDRQFRAKSKQIYMLTQEVDQLWKKEKEILLKLDEDPDFLLKAYSAFGEGEIDKEWLFSKATPERLEQELEKLVNEYYELWMKITSEIQIVIN